MLNFAAYSSAVSFLRLDTATISKSSFKDCSAGICPYFAQPAAPTIPVPAPAPLIEDYPELREFASGEDGQAAASLFSPS